MKTCLCGKGPLNPGMTTCGSSYCQEASYLSNVASNMRKGKKKEDAEAQARVAIQLACDMAKKAG